MPQQSAGRAALIGSRGGDVSVVGVSLLCWIADRASHCSGQGNGQGCGHHANKGRRDHVSGPFEVWLGRTRAAEFDMPTNSFTSR